MFPMYGTNFTRWLTIHQALSMRASTSWGTMSSIQFSPPPRFFGEHKMNRSTTKPGFVGGPCLLPCLLIDWSLSNKSAINILIHRIYPILIYFECVGKLKLQFSSRKCWLTIGLRDFPLKIHGNQCATLLMRSGTTNLGPRTQQLRDLRLHLHGHPLPKRCMKNFIWAIWICPKIGYL